MFNWNRLFPFQKQFSKETLKNSDPKDVEQYVNQVMESVFGSNYSAQFPFQDPLSQTNQKSETDDQKRKEPNIELFETTDHVFVKIELTHPNKDQVKIKHTANLLYIDHFPEENTHKKIVLPAAVKRKGTKASYQDGILEIMFLKHDDPGISEIDIPL
ncbi:Hsp20/alpha crystallin family protein [Bacillus sp. 179-C3.3 HS]|uniref:Hsp20/alpha crystallin family protein n=1 Tax=Bacillus sp. 179-C3.3 HS TaxID=3232162 RepID=UPI00399F2294